MLLRRRLQNPDRARARAPTSAALDPRLPRAVYVLELGALVNAFGNGVVLPFLLIYLHNVRGIPFGLAGSAAAVQSTAALASGFLGGTLSDRVGPKRVLLGALAVMTVAFALMPLIRTAWEAFAIYTLWGIGSGSFWPSQSALLAGLTPADAARARLRAAAARDERRRRARRRRRRADRVGRESGDVHRPLRDQLRDVRRLHGRARAGFAPRRCTRAGSAAAGGAVLRDRVFTLFTLLNAAFMTAAISVAVELLPAFGEERDRDQRAGGRDRLRARRDRGRALPAARREARRGPEPDARAGAHGDCCGRRRSSPSGPPARGRARLRRSGSSPPRCSSSRSGSACTGRSRHRSASTSRRRSSSAATSQRRASRGRSAGSSARRRAASSSSTGRSCSGRSPRESTSPARQRPLALERRLPERVRRTPRGETPVVPVPASG